MTSISHSIKYLPHDLNTKYYSVLLYRQTKSISHVIRRYHISKSSLMRWNKQFNGNKDSLIDKSHKPLSKHPNSHTDEEIKWIKDYLKRNPKISFTLSAFGFLSSFSYLVIVLLLHSPANPKCSEILSCDKCLNSLTKAILDP